MSKADDFYLIDLSFNGDLEAAPNGDLQTITGLNNLRQALFNRLVTVPGTLIHRPKYGVGAKLWQNKIATLGNQRELALRIRDQFQQDFRVDSVESVLFSQQANGEFLVKYKVIAKGVTLDETVNPFGDIEV